MLSITIIKECVNTGKFFSCTGVRGKILPCDQDCLAMDSRLKEINLIEINHIICSILKIPLVIIQNKKAGRLDNHLLGQV